MSSTLLCLKRKLLSQFPQKCYKTTERHSLEVCSTLCGEKQLFFYNYPILLIRSKTVV